MTHASNDIVPLRQAGDMTTREAMQADVEWVHGNTGLFPVAIWDSGDLPSAK